MTSSQSQASSTATQSTDQAGLTFDPSKAFAPVPADQPHQQRAICMIKGKLIIVDAKKNEGVLKVKNQLFPCVFTGRLKPMFMVKQVNKFLCFNAWPKESSATDNSSSKLLLQLHSFRKNIAPEANRLCELRGHIANIHADHFFIKIYSQKTQESFSIPVLGDCPGQEGQLYKVDGYITPQGLQMLSSEPISKADA